MDTTDSTLTQEKRPISILLDSYERQRLERFAQQWGLPLAGAVRRLIRETEINLKAEEVTEETAAA